MVVPQHCVRWIGAIAATDVVLIHRGHVTNLIEVADREPLVEAPTAIATRPLVDIAAPYAHLLELSVTPHAQRRGDIGLATGAIAVEFDDHVRDLVRVHQRVAMLRADVVDHAAATTLIDIGADRSEEHTSELQSLMRISYAVFCLKKKKNEQ